MGVQFSEIVTRYIEQHQLLRPDGRYLVAVSGGADSVCLLLLLHRLGYQVEAAHCNFKLRSSESDRDELFVVSFCQQHDIPLHIIHFGTRTYAKTHQVSIEMAARELRYQYFEQLLVDLNADAVCVAHHQDDSVETILMNLLRGTGLHGLTGISPRFGHVVRPLLCVSRQQIEQWLAEQHQSYVTDSSNLVADVVRNKIRLNVLPQLRNITPHASAGILATARRLSEASLVYDHAIAQTLQPSTDAFAIGDLLAMPSAESILFEWLSPYGFSPAIIQQISQRLPYLQSGRHWLSSTHQLTVHQQRLLLSPLAPPPPTLQIPFPGLYVSGETDVFRLELHEGPCILRASSVACLDTACFRFPLIIRPIQAGDRFQPLGMTGTRLISDFLTDLKLSLPDKRRQQVVTDANGQILWLVDHRLDNRYCVTPQTRQTLTILHEHRH